MTINDRAAALKRFLSIKEAIAQGALEQFQDLSLSEAIVLGLWNQDVKKFAAIFGHGTTDIANVLRVYEEYGLLKTYNMRHETAAAHAVTALNLMTGEKAAVVTSIGPGALQAFAGALCSASNGVGVYHIYGDETTEDEGFNMQQIPKDEQGLFLKLCSVMGNAYSLMEPLSIFAALRRGAVATGKKGAGEPFFLLAPMNMQPSVIKNCNLLEFPEAYTEPVLACVDDALFEKATRLARSAKKITIKIGNGARGAGREIVELAGLLDAAIVSGASSSGIVAYREPRYMTVGGSKGSISGNYAMNEADFGVVVGARAVCQWDSSGTAWKNAAHIVNFNVNSYHAKHYNRSVGIVGDAKINIMKWIAYLKADGFTMHGMSSEWAKNCSAKKKEWELFKNDRFECPPLEDGAWKRAVLTQPVAIKTVCDFADRKGVVKFFDAGDVQANGFQIVEDGNEQQTITDTGASYMGFAASALMATAMTDRTGAYACAFVGDGCFMMNPQILIDGIEHGARGCIVVFDNRRMAAISGLQLAQYGIEYKTSDSVEVDYAAMAGSVRKVKTFFGGTSIAELTSALDQAFAYDGLSFIHVPVYSGSDERAGMGVFGDWNVGNCCERVQAEHHKIGL